MQLFRFANPEFLYLLLFIPVMILLFIINSIRRKRSLKRIGDPHLVEKLLPERSSVRPLVKFILQIFAVSAAVIMLGRPQFGSKIEEVRKEGVEVIIALDVSNSMYQRGHSANRLAKTKETELSRDS